MKKLAYSSYPSSRNNPYKHKGSTFTWDLYLIILIMIIAGLVGQLSEVKECQELGFFMSLPCSIGLLIMALVDRD